MTAPAYFQALGIRSARRLSATRQSSLKALTRRNLNRCFYGKKMKDKIIKCNFSYHLFFIKFKYVKLNQMKILAVSDSVVSSFLEPDALRKYGRGMNLILACGDLPPYYLELLIGELNVPLYYIPGNHDDRHVHFGPTGSDFVRGGCNLEGTTTIINGLIIAGLGGAQRYRPGRYLLSESQMNLKMSALAPELEANHRRYGRFVDILITHAPPLGIHDGHDLPHRGFKAFLGFIKTYRPAYLLHGHTISARQTSLSRYQSTQIININPHRIVKIENGYF